MNDTQIGWMGVTASLLLVAIAVGLSLWQQLHLTRSMLWSSARAAVQLLLVGFALRLVLDSKASVWWAWLWVVVMIIFAGFTIRSREKEIPGIFLLGTITLKMA